MRRSPFLAAFAFATAAGAPSASAKTVNVTNVTDLLAAISGAAAGDEIVLASGTYALSQSPVCGASGTTDALIRVTATPSPGSWSGPAVRTNCTTPAALPLACGARS